MNPLAGSRAPPNTPNRPTYVNVATKMYTPHTSCATLTYLNSTEFQYNRRRSFVNLFFFLTAMADVSGPSCGVSFFKPDEDFVFGGDEQEDIDVACDVTVRVDVNDDVDTLVDIDWSGDVDDTDIGDDPGCRSTIFCCTMVFFFSLLDPDSNRE